MQKQSTAEGGDLKLLGAIERGFRPPLHQLLEKLPFPAYLCDADGLIVYFNSRAAEVWGREPKLDDPQDRYCGSLRMFAPDGTPIPHDQGWMAVALREQRDVLGEEIVVERPSGDRVTALAYVRPIRDDAGRLSGALNLLVDISERASAREVQARLAAIIDSSNDAIISKSLDGRIQSWNAGAERIFGYSAEEAIGQSVLMIIPPERANEEEVILGRLRRGERIGHFETVRIAKGGRRVDVSLTISPIRDRSERVIGASKVARDITFERRAREMLREADRLKDEFLAILAHELRNRLAPIRNAVEALIAAGSLVPDAKPAVDLIDRQTIQMVRLVEDLLDVSRIARNELKLRRKRVKLQDVLREAFEVSRPLIDEREQVLTVTGTERAIYVQADRVRLAQAITNLLNNAARYTDRGGHIWLGAERQGDWAVLTVRDDGAGISPEMIPRVFEMFVSGLERSQLGLGVGLTLVKRIVELHKGTVEARSEGRGTGSTFIVRIPLAKGRPRRRAEPAAQPAPQSVRRVLVVDDDRDLANSLAMSLQSTGHEVRTAFDGPEALAVASEFRPDAVAIDVSLPTMSGFDVISQLRQCEWGKQIVAVAVTGWSEDDARERAREAGFDHFLVKPVNGAELARVFDTRSD